MRSGSRSMCRICCNGRLRGSTRIRLRSLRLLPPARNDRLSSAMRKIVFFLFLSVVSGLPVLAQGGHEAFNKPFPAFKVIGNVYYVGTDDLGSFLITTPEGNILINSDFEDTVPQIRDRREGYGDGAGHPGDFEDDAGE